MGEGLLLRGMRWRLGLSLLTVLTAAIAVATAVLGPMYLHTAGDSVLRRTVDSAALQTRGVTLTPYYSPTHALALARQAEHIVAARACGQSSVRRSDHDRDRRDRDPARPPRRSAPTCCSGPGSAGRSTFVRGRCRPRPRRRGADRAQRPPGSHAARRRAHVLARSSRRAHCPGHRNRRHSGSGRGVLVGPGRRGLPVRNAARSPRARADRLGDRLAGDRPLGRRARRALGDRAAAGAPRQRRPRRSGDGDARPRPGGRRPAAAAPPPFDRPRRAALERRPPAARDGDDRRDRRHPARRARGVGARQPARALRRRPPRGGAGRPPARVPGLLDAVGDLRPSRRCCA